MSLDGGFLARGFWIYVWEVRDPEGSVMLYVGRTGDSSSPNAQSPFNRMGQHLGFAKNSSMLRNHLKGRDVSPDLCSFRLVAHGPILPEAEDWKSHVIRRDLAAAVERQPAESELATCENLLIADGPDGLAQEYLELVSIARSTAGREAHEAWKVDPITEDVEMNMPDLFGRLKPLNDGVGRFREHISWAGKTRRAKVRMWRRPPRSG